MKSRRAKATDIPQSVKQEVWERDQGRCVICGNGINVMPNAHYISRAKGGLGIAQNIFTACTRMTPTDCHYRYDNGTQAEREAIRSILQAYFQSKYPGWNESDLIYRKWRE